MNHNGTATNCSPHLKQYTTVTGQVMPSYDEKFNLSGYADWTYVYDAEKRLIPASAVGYQVQFIYDGLGCRVKRATSTVATMFTYDEWKLIVEWTGASDFVAWNLCGARADEILARCQPNTGGHGHYHFDAMGNVQSLLSCELHLEKYSYDAFGKATITGWNGNVHAIGQYGDRFLITGREFLHELGIYDYGNRSYHARLGRFLQTDPTGCGDGDMNLFRYCGYDPVDMGDSTREDYEIAKPKVPLR